MEKPVSIARNDKKMDTIKIERHVKNDHDKIGVQASQTVAEPASFNQSIPSFLP